jgi:hypothetical protein
LFNQKVKFSPKTIASNISMLEPIQDNDNNKPHTWRQSQRPYGSRQDDGDAGDDDVLSDDNTDILSSL